MDGLADGIVNDPERCHFDPQVLACKKDDGPDCLMPDEVKAVAAIYGGAKNPRTGDQIFPGESPGSELGWAGLLHIPGPTLTSQSYFQFALHRNPEWNVEALNFDRDVSSADRIDGGILNDISPDLHDFKAKGGKLIMFHGWSDPIIAPLESVNYYESVVDEMGGAKNTATASSGYSCCQELDTARVVPEQTRSTRSTPSKSGLSTASRRTCLLLHIRARTAQ